MGSSSISGIGLPLCLEVHGVLEVRPARESTCTAWTQWTGFKGTGAGEHRAGG